MSNVNVWVGHEYVLSGFENIMDLVIVILKPEMNLKSITGRVLTGQRIRSKDQICELRPAVFVTTCCENLCKEYKGEDYPNKSNVNLQKLIKYQQSPTEQVNTAMVARKQNTNDV